MNKKVFIIYLLSGDEPGKYLERALQGIAAQTYNKKNLEVLIVYNPMPDENQLPFIEHQSTLHSEFLPEVKVLGQKTNIGFSAANNVGMRYALEHGADFIFLHNGDGYLHGEAIEKMVSQMESDEKIGQVQAMILLGDEINKINTSGNDWQYLGIGYCRDYKMPIDNFKEASSEIGYASGAATMLRADLLQKFGLWKEDFFLYHEDTDYSLRLRSLGYRVTLEKDAYFYHHYEFSKNKKKFFWIERNRHAIKILYYRWPTLILLIPIDLVYNLGLVIYSLSNGWFNELVKVYVYWLKPKNWKIWLKYRREIQANRQVSDRFLLNAAVMKVSTNQIENRLALTMANAVFTFYGILLKLLVWW